MPQSAEFPRWSYFPRNRAPDPWVFELIGAVRNVRAAVQSASVSGLSSDLVLANLRPGLEGLGYKVEAGRLATQRIRRPVLFGPQGASVVEYDVDAVHDVLRIVIEIEAGRGAKSNAVYRDLIRASLVVDIDFLVLGVIDVYRHLSAGKGVNVPSFDDAFRQIDAIYASGRLRLPFKGLLLFGY